MDVVEANKVDDIEFFKACNYAVNTSYYGLYINADASLRDTITQSCARARESGTDTVVEVRVRIDDTTFDMTYEEFLRRLTRDA